MEVSPGIYQLKVPIPNNPLGNLLAYLVKASQGYLLVDAGWPSPEGMKALEQQLQGLGLAFTDIKTLVITHLHLDHFGLAPKIREISGAQIAFHRAEMDHDRPQSSGEDFFTPLKALLQRNGMPPAEMEQLEGAARPPGGSPGGFRADRILEDGEVLDLGIRRLEVIWTPGHSAGHICLYDRENRILFSGDHILPVITPNVSLNHRSPPNPLRDFVSSLAKVEPLEVDLALPAHEHIFRNFRERIKQLFHHHKARLEAVLRAMEGRPKTAYDIAEKVPWDLAPWKDMATMDRRSAVTETLAHLEFLCREGRAAREERGELHFYRPA